MDDKTTKNVHHGRITGGSKTDSNQPRSQREKEEETSVLNTDNNQQVSVKFNGKTYIRRSAINIKDRCGQSSAGSASGDSGRERNEPNLQLAKTKPGIVLVLGQQTDAYSSASISGTGVSSSLQQSVNVHDVSGKFPGANIMSRVVYLTSPNVPCLTAMLSSPLTNKNTLSSNSSRSNTTTVAAKVMPQIMSTSTNTKSSNKVTSPSDVPISRNPSSTPSGTAKMHTATDDLLQVATVPSLCWPNTRITNCNAEYSCKYRDYVVKQNFTKKVFQKQIEHKIVRAAYPKSFRQVWPLIPTQKSVFVRHYGLECVTHYLNSTSSTAHEKKVNIVHPYCTLCGFDFASSWQIRQKNSKRLLYCETCDIQNIKTTQRLKLENHFKILIDTIKKEESKFDIICEAGKKQFLLQENMAAERTPLLVTNSCNPLVQTKGIPASSVSSTAQTNLANTISALRMKLYNHFRNSAVSSTCRRTLPFTTSSSSGPMSSTKKQVLVGLKRKHTRGRDAATRQVDKPPPSKVSKPGLVLDMSLIKINQQLLTQKLDQKKDQSKDHASVEGSSKINGSGTINPECKGTTDVAKLDFTVAHVACVEVDTPSVSPVFSAIPTPSPGSADNSVTTGLERAANGVSPETGNTGTGNTGTGNTGTGNTGDNLPTEEGASEE